MSNQDRAAWFAVAFLFAAVASGVTLLVERQYNSPACPECATCEEPASAPAVDLQPMEKRLNILDHNQELLLVLLDTVVSTKQWGTRVRLPTGVGEWQVIIDGVVHSFDVNARARQKLR